MRTTIDLPEDLHQMAGAIARDTSRTLSATVADLMRRGLAGARSGGVAQSQLTGLLTVKVGTIITSEDVHAVTDDEP